MVAIQCVQHITMKLSLLNSANIAFNKKDELLRVIPYKMNGKVLNYGQGEGQIEIEGVVFGFYLNNENIYYMQFEEGVIDWIDLVKLIDAIILKIEKEFNSNIKLMAEGFYTNVKSI